MSSTTMVPESRRTNDEDVIPREVKSPVKDWLANQLSRHDGGVA